MKYKMLRYLAYTLEIIVFYVLEQTPRLIFPIFGAKPLFIIPALLMISLFEGEMAGFGFGIFVGVLLDVSFSWSLGFYTVVMPIMGYVVGWISRNIIKNTLPSAALLSGIFVPVIYTLHFLVYYVFSGYTDTLYAYIHHYLPGIFYTFSTCVLFYYFNRAFAVIIRDENSPEDGANTAF